MEGTNLAEMSKPFCLEALALPRIGEEAADTPAAHVRQPAHLKLSINTGEP